ncbi:MAG: DUF6088 family protein [Acidobacteriota bacterium]
MLAGDVRRIDRGFYDVPRTNSLTGKPSRPDYTAIIDAVARREKARFLPDGITAANQWGLTDAGTSKSHGSHRRPASPDSSRQPRHQLQTHRADPSTNVGFCGRSRG